VTPPNSKGEILVEIGRGAFTTAPVAGAAASSTSIRAPEMLVIGLHRFAHFAQSIPTPLIATLSMQAIGQSVIPRRFTWECFFRPLDDATRHRFERNTGTQVAIVIRGTPAFSANFLEGDILLKINGRDIVDGQSLTAELPQLAGQQVTIDLLRGDQPRTIAVTLNP